MTDYTELKRLAEAAKDDPSSPYIPCQVGFQSAATPEVVLALVKEIESHKRMLLAAVCDLGAIGEALKSDMDADGDELLGMVIDLKAQNTRMLEWLKDISRTSGDKGAVMGARQLLKEFAE